MFSLLRLAQSIICQNSEIYENQQQEKKENQQQAKKESQEWALEVPLKFTRATMTTTPSTSTCIVWAWHKAPGACSKQSYKQINGLFANMFSCTPLCGFANIIDLLLLWWQHFIAIAYWSCRGSECQGEVIFVDKPVVMMITLSMVPGMLVVIVISQMGIG
jgi:hypothetical protein